jgi:hypothetical protein
MSFGQEPTLLRKLQGLPVILRDGDGTARSRSPPAPEHFVIAAKANEICGSLTVWLIMSIIAELAHLRFITAISKNLRGKS